MSYIQSITEHPELVDEAARLGCDMLYLVTEHVGLYERCGWRCLGDASEPDGGKIRLYGVPSLDAGDAGGSRCMC